jgi:hypothetical protein
LHSLHNLNISESTSPHRRQCLTGKKVTAPDFFSFDHILAAFCFFCKAEWNQRQVVSVLSHVAFASNDFQFPPVLIYEAPKQLSIQVQRETTALMHFLQQHCQMKNLMFFQQLSLLCEYSLLFEKIVCHS